MQGEPWFEDDMGVNYCYLSPQGELPEENAHHCADCGRWTSDSDAPGITAFRQQLSHVLGSRPVSALPHEQIIAKLDDAGKTFRVLIIKTNLTLPYTSVFLQLDCGYWSADAERRLRESMVR